MAQLTWRNVDSPTFSGVTDALRLAGQSLTAGLSAGRDAIGDFQKVQGQAESAKLIGATAGVTDPQQLKSIIAGFDPALVSPDALKTALGRPQDLATLDSTRATTGQTQARTIGIGIDNKFNEENNPLRIENQRLDNAGKVITNAKDGVELNQNIWKNDLARKEAAAAPAWNQQLAQYRALRGSADPADQARAATLAATPGFAETAASAGVKGDTLAGVLDKGEAAATNAIRLKEMFLALPEKERVANLTSTARSLVDNVIADTGSPAGGSLKIQNDTTLPADLRDAALKRLQEVAPNYKTMSEAEILAGSASAAAGSTAPARGPVAAPTQQASGRPVLDLFTSAAKANGLEVTSGYRGADDPLTKANPNSQHAQGRAFDLRARNTDDADTVMAKQRQIFSSYGMQEGTDYKIKDEVRNPAGHATGPHVHVELTPAGEAKQRAALEGGSGAALTNRIMEARGPQVGGPVITAPRGPQVSIGPAPGLGQTAQAAAASFQPGVRLETPQDLVTNRKTLDSMLSSASVTSTMDGQLSAATPIAEAFRSNKSTSALEVAAQLHKKSGGDKEDDGGWFGRDKLSVEKINDAVQKVQKDFNVSADIAGALIESSVATTGGTFLRRGRDVDYDKLKTQIERFVDKTGKPKTEVLNIIDGKASIEKQVTEIKAKVDQAKEIWLGAESAAKNGNARINVQAERERYANAQRAADAMIRQIQLNPNLMGNSKANTGR